MPTTRKRLLSAISCLNLVFFSTFNVFILNYSETCFLKISNDALLASDSGKLSLLLSFDFSSAFDTFDYSLLLQHLNSFFGISGSSIFLLTSYLSKLSSTVSIIILFFFCLFSFWCSSEICFRASSLCFLYLSSPLFYRIFLFPKSALC